MYIPAAVLIDAENFEEWANKNKKGLLMNEKISKQMAKANQMDSEKRDAGEIPAELRRDRKNTQAQTETRGSDVETNAERKEELRDRLGQGSNDKFVQTEADVDLDK